MTCFDDDWQWNDAALPENPSQINHVRVSSAAYLKNLEKRHEKAVRHRAPPSMIEIPSEQDEEHDDSTPLLSRQNLWHLTCCSSLITVFSQSNQTSSF